MSKAALAFAAGFGGGYLDQKQADKEQARIEEDRAFRKQEQQYQLDERQRQKNERVSLADAARPATVEQGAGGMLRPETMDNRDVGLPENQALPNQGLSAANFRVAGKPYTDAAGANAAAAQYNAPEATDQRVSLAMAQAGNPLAAKQYQAATQQGQMAGLQVKKAQDDMDRNAGFREAATAFATGGWSSVPQIYDRYKDGMKATVAEDGKGGAVVTRTNDKGEVVDTTPFASKLDFIGQMMSSFDPKAWAASEERKVETARTQGNREQDQKLKLREFEEIKKPLANARATQAESQGQAALMRASRPSGGGGASGGATTVQSTKTDSNGNLILIMKDGTTKTPMMDGKPVRANDQSAVNQMYRSLKGDVNNLMAEPSVVLEQAKGMVRGPALSDARATQEKAPVAVSSKAQRDQLPKGTRYTGPDGQTYIKQ